MRLLLAADLGFLPPHLEQPRGVIEAQGHVTPIHEEEPLAPGQLLNSVSNRSRITYSYSRIVEYADDDANLIKTRLSNGAGTDFGYDGNGNQTSHRVTPSTVTICAPGSVYIS